MINHRQISALLLLLSALSCAGQNSGLRSGSSDNSSAPAPEGNSKGDDAGKHDNIAKASDVIPITGVNLAEVLVYVKCVSDAESSCKQVRLGAEVKVGSELPVRFAADTTLSLGIKSSSWKFTDLPQGVSCQSTDAGFAYNPLCTGSSSLASVRIKARLTAVANDGTTVKGDAPNSPPVNDGTIHGNFMLLNATGGLTPSGATYIGASAPFSQVWQDLVSGLYLTNILYDGSGTPSTDWDKANTLCAAVNSGGGVREWNMPTIEQWCGGTAGVSRDSSEIGCNGGLYSHGIKNVTFAGGAWPSYMWSSSVVSGNTFFAWVANLSNGNSYFNVKGNANDGVFCVR